MAMSALQYATQGQWDNSFRVESLEKGRIIAWVAYHQGAWYLLYVFIEWRSRRGGGI